MELTWTRPDAFVMALAEENLMRFVPKLGETTEIGRLYGAKCRGVNQAKNSTDGGAKAAIPTNNLSLWEKKQRGVGGLSEMSRKVAGALPGGGAA